MPELWQSFNTYCRREFGAKAAKICLDAGAGCPHRVSGQLETGCCFCHPGAYAGQAVESASLEEQWEAGVASAGRHGAEKYLAYFQAGSNTHGSAAALSERFQTLAHWPECAGVIVATRPECIHAQAIEILLAACQGKPLWIEVGVQACDDAVLQWLGRGHTLADCAQALRMLAAYPEIKTTAHLVFGSPLEHARAPEDAAGFLNQHRVAGVKITPLYVARHTRLAKDFQAGRFRPLGCEDYRHRVIRLLEQLSPATVVMRLTADCRQEFLLAPDWLGDKAGWLRGLRQAMEQTGAYQGRLFQPASGNAVASV
jgi:hypothetical protein